MKATSREEIAKLHQLGASGVGGLCALVEGNQLVEGLRAPAIVADLASVEVSDVVAMTPGVGLQVLYRESDTHHTVFLTNRCNSRCVMCSQPPTTHYDSWLADEAKQIARHIRRAPAVLGFTGGEPLLLGEELRYVLDSFLTAFTQTQLEVLTNGRLFNDADLAKTLLLDLPRRVSWMVPLYGHADLLHDDIVRAEGAFDETIGGLLNLQAFAQPIQLRVVLIEPVLQILPDLCSFVARNLPFVREVALMGCEPTGFALANRSICEVDVRKWEAGLSRSVRTLHRAGIPALLMNLPLCAIPIELRPFAQRSISDWKQAYAPECQGCAVRSACCGLFAWHKSGWRPTVLRPILEEAVL